MLIPRLSKKNSFAPYVFKNDLNILNSPIFLKNESSFEKVPPTKNEGFHMPLFDLH